MNYFPLLIATLMLFACSRVKEEGKELLDATKQKSADLADKVHPHFDAYKADTKYNKLRFNDFLKVPITDDVKNIYCFDDAIGIDADYQFSFSCSKETADKIIATHEMKLIPSKNDFAFGLQTEFDWWKLEDIKKLNPHIYQSEDEQYFKYFWYDTKKGKAYFFDFDM